jgi:hypothetical protein
VISGSAQVALAGGLAASLATLFTARLVSALRHIPSMRTLTRFVAAACGDRRALVKRLQSQSDSSGSQSDSSGVPSVGMKLVHIEVASRT